MKTRDITFIAICVALITIGSWISIPIGQVPITLQTFAIFFVALLLEPKISISSVGVWILLGIVGLPVFAGFKGGFGVIVGPTGGYLIAFFISTIIVALAKKKSRMLAFILSFVTLFIIVYPLGTLQLSLLTKMEFKQALAVGVLPFVIFDVIKIAIAIVIVPSVEKGIAHIHN